MTLAGQALLSMVQQKFQKVQTENSVQLLLQKRTVTGTAESWRIYLTKTGEAFASSL
jgi:hypothetical protein